MLRVAFLNVGQGDTAVVCNPETREAIVIDCFNSLAVWDFLRCERIQRVRSVVITHLHADHYGELVTFLNGCQSRGIEWDAVYFQWLTRMAGSPLLDDEDEHSQSEGDSSALRKKKRRSLFQNLAAFFAQAENKRRHKSPESLNGANIPGMALELLHPISGDIGRLIQIGKLNNLSVVLRVEGNGSSVLFMGDLEPDGWDILSENTPDLESDVLKFPHHGAWRRDDVDVFLRRINPKIVVVSVGTAGHQYDHPNTRVFKALISRTDTHVLCTQATVKCVADPNSVQKKASEILADVGSKYSGIQTSSGCPCASTIIIDLGDQARIVHPPRTVHDQIIQECFPAAQCRKKDLG